MLSTDFQILQANQRKSREVSHSFFNDEGLQPYSAIFTKEPWAKLENGTCFTAPAYHTYWQLFYPTKHAIPLEGRSSSPFRAMIWTNKKFANVQQIAIPHPDICAVIL